MDNAKNLSDYQLRAIADGYTYECGCGELYNSVGAAWECRKCRKYLSFERYDAREVVDIRTGEVVP